MHARARAGAYPSPPARTRPLRSPNGACLPRPLQVARKYEQSDAEGVLLRAGARDPGAPAGLFRSQ